MKPVLFSSFISHIWIIYLLRNLCSAYQTSSRLFSTQAALFSHNRDQNEIDFSVAQFQQISDSDLRFLHLCPLPWASHHRALILISLCWFVFIFFGSLHCLSTILADTDLSLVSYIPQYCLRIKSSFQDQLFLPFWAEKSGHPRVTSMFPPTFNTANFATAVVSCLGSHMDIHWCAPNVFRQEHHMHQLEIFNFQLRLEISELTFKCMHFCLDTRLFACVCPAFVCLFCNQQCICCWFICYRPVCYHGSQWEWEDNSSQHTRLPPRSQHSCDWGVPLER